MNHHVLEQQGIMGSLWYRFDDSPLSQNRRVQSASGDDHVLLGDYDLDVPASK
jgi:hypothetical protein